MPAVDPIRRRTRATLDLRQPLPPPVRRRQPITPPVTRPVPTTRPTATAAPARVAKPKRRWLNLLQYPAFAIGGLLAAYSTSFGQWIVLGFVVVAVLTRRRSNLSFGAALFLLVTIPLFQIIGQTGIAQNVAVYVFELLVFGTVQAVWEASKMSST